MKKCVLFFIVLISTLIVAILTDDDRSLLQEDVLVKYKMETDVNIVEQTLPAPDY